MKKLIAIFLAIYSFNANGQVITDGIKALEADKINQAKKIFMNLASLNSKTPDPYFYLGSIYLEEGQMDSAKAVFTKALEMAPENALTYVGLGKFNQAGKNSDEAKLNFDKALLLCKSKDVKILTHMAESYAVTENPDYPKAIETGNKALLLDKKNAMTYLTLGDIYIRNANGTEAIKHYEKALELNPKMDIAHARIGKLYTQARNFRVALASFESALKLNPECVTAYRDLAELYYLSKQYDKAVENYDKYLNLSERNVTTLSRYASFLFLTKDYSKTTVVINEIMAIDSSNAILSRLKGYSSFEQGDYKNGLASMEKFFKDINPKKIIASDYEYYGKLLVKNSNDSIAAINLLKAIEMDTTRTDLYDEIGEIYTRSKKYGDAITIYSTKLLKVKNPSALDYFFLGKSYYFNKDYLNADTAFMKVVELKPNATAGYLWRARCNNVDVEKNLEGAKPYYEKFIELGANDPKVAKKELVEAYSYFGYYHIQKDDNVNAKTYYQELLKIDPENKQAKEIMKSLK